MSGLLSCFIGTPRASRLRFPKEFDEVLSVLSALSLDGAMRLVWILGVESGFKGDLANARRRRDMSAAASIVDAGFVRLQALLRTASHGSGTKSGAPASSLLVNALRRMLEDGATEGDRHFAHTCIEVILPPQSWKKSGRRHPAVGQLPLLFEDTK